jgi:hypothetical protein
MSPTAKPDIKPATGKLGILTPGMGAVATPSWPASRRFGAAWPSRSAR